MPQHYRFVSFTPETCDEIALHIPSVLMNTLLDQYVLAVESDNMCPTPLTIAVPFGHVSNRLRCV